MVGNAKVQNLAPAMFEYQEHEQHLHADGGHGEEINRDHLADMIVKESLPRLTRWSRKAAQNSGYRALGNQDAEHLEFTVDTRRTPQWMGGDHLLNHPANIGGDRWPTRPASRRF